MVWLWIFGGLVLLIVLIFFYYYNRFNILENRIDNSNAQIDVQLKRRNDLIPNLIETVKGYVKHEKTLLENITKARSAMLGATSLEQKAKMSNQLTETLKSLFAVAENYPTLRANENFKQLHEEL